MALPALKQVEEAEQSVQPEDVFHAILIALGASAIALNAHRRLPEAIGVLGSLSFGLWLGLLVHSWQVHSTPFGGKLPRGCIIPATVGVAAGLAAGLFVELFWRAGLAFLSAMLMSFLLLAICRLFDLPIDMFFGTNIEFFSTYRVLGLASLLVALVVCGFLVKTYDAELLLGSSVHLGTLLLLSGLSHFAARLFDQQESGSLVDGLAHVLAAVYEDGGCGGGSGGGDGDGSGRSRSLCSCGAKCKVEILAWFLLSWLIILALVLIRRHSKPSLPTAAAAK